MTNLFNKSAVENTINTSGGGFAFETRVRAYFLAQMYLRGIIPSVPYDFKIKKIVFQSRDFNTDDIVVYLKNQTGELEIKILCQLKIGVSATISSSDFEKAIIDAWADYKSNNFDHRKDRVFFIMGLFNQADNRVIQILRDLVNDNSGGSGFWEKYNNTKSYSKLVVDKFKKIISYITKANLGLKPPEKDIFNFLSAFRIIRSDLHEDLVATGGLNLSLIQDQFRQEFNGCRFAKDPQDIWNGFNIYCRDHENGIPITSSDFSSEYLTKLLETEAIIKRPEEYRTTREAPIVNIVSHELEITRLNLIGSWDESYVGDKQVIVKILGVESYDKANEIIQKIIKDYPNLLYFSDGRYKLKKRKQIIKEIPTFVTNSLLESSSSLFEEILLEQDPLAGLSYGERVKARIDGVNTSYSPLIRTGIANTLAMLSNNSSTLIHASNAAGRIPLQVLKKVISREADWRTYISIRPILTILAEINPRIYLERVEDLIDVYETEFSRYQRATTGHSLLGDHDTLSELLSSLALVAWSDDTLFGSYHLLARIADIVNSEFYLDKISEIMTRILLPWHPQTASPIERRFSVVETTLKENPKLGWKVLAGLLPNVTLTSTDTLKPYWLESMSDDRERQKVSLKDFREQSQHYLELSLLEMKKDPVRLLDQAHYLQQCRENDHILKVLKYLSSNEAAALPSKLKQKIRNELAQLLLNNEWRNEDIRLPKELVAELSRSIKNLSFSGTLGEALLLFDTDDWLLVNNFKSSTMEEGEKLLLEKREDMIKKVLNLPDGYENIKKLAVEMKSQNINRIGTALSVINDDSIIAQIFPNLLNYSNPLWGIAAGFTRKKFYTDGIDWFNLLNVSNWSNEQKITLLNFLPLNRSTWVYASSILGNDTEYWNKLQTQTVNPYSLGDKVEDYEYAVEKLASVGKNVTAITCLGICLHQGMKPDTAICLKALDINNNFKEKFSQNAEYDITKIFEYLQKQPDNQKEDLPRIEWMYLPYFSFGSSFRPQALINFMKSDPSLFIEIIRVTCKSTKPDYQKPELADGQSERIYSLLYNYEIIPGLFNRSLDEDMFKDWIDRALSETNESGHLKNALYVIGEILSKSPLRDGGLYIDKSIATLLDEKEYQRMRDGYRIGILNSDGIKTVDPTGSSELKKSEAWKERAQSVESLGLRHFAKTLRLLSDDYKNQSEWEKRHGSFEDHLGLQFD